jgi:hypothetical protein
LWNDASENPVAIPVDIFHFDHCCLMSIGTSLFVSAWFIFTDSFPAFVLNVILDHAIEEIFSVLVGVVAGSWSRLKLSVASLHIGGLLSFVGQTHVLPILESGNLVLVLSVAVALLVNSGDIFC